MGALTEPQSTRSLLVWWAAGFCALTIFALAAEAISFGPAGKALPSAAAGLAASPVLVGALLYFFAVYLALHVALAVAWEWSSRPLVVRVAPPGQVRQLAVLSFLPLLVGLLLANLRLFPQSMFAPDLSVPMARAAYALLWMVIAYAAAVVVIGIAWRLRSSVARRIAGVLSGSLLVLVAVDAGLLSSTDTATPRGQPDIIFIGVDGLRPDHVDPVLTPALHALLADAVRVEHAWTPLARTFPAWVSVLTGQYPTTHGAHFNLMPRESVDDSTSLAHQFGGLGYRRVYAIDETRFSNMDRSFGFDRVVAPTAGAFDFLLSVLGDMPAVNLVSNTRAGRILFPYAYINRGLAVSYRPETFDRAVRRAVDRVDPRAPLFLIVHFELPHWPYSWAGSERYQPRVPDRLQPLSPSHYHAAVAKADEQVGALVAVLERAGRLRNAALVLLSDHGEAFRERDPRWTHDSGYMIEDVHAGHGTHVMSAAQNRVLLAFRGFGSVETPGAPGSLVRATASLVDVRPTLHEWLRLPLPRSVRIDGESLLSVLHGAPHDERVVLVETGFSPPSVAEGAPDIGTLLDESARYYDVTASGRLKLRTELLEELLGAKQYAAVSGEWLFAALPETPGRPARLLLGNFDTRIAWDADRVELMPAQAPVTRLLDALCGRHAGERDLLTAACAGSIR